MDLLDALQEIKDRIPEGVYCYSGEYKCPYWDMIDVWSEQDKEMVEVGYCKYLEREDPILLWDQCKICGIKEN